MPKIPPEIKSCPNRELMIWLDTEYQKLSDKHYKAAPKSGTIPVGGGEWMDCFFRMEAIRGCLTALRHLKPLAVAIEEGKVVSEIAVEIWNKQRKGDYTVQRWSKTAHDYLETLVKTFNMKAKK